MACMFYTYLIALIILAKQYIILIDNYNLLGYKYWQLGSIGCVTCVNQIMV